jgi:hypothetical protein
VVLTPNSLCKAIPNRKNPPIAKPILILKKYEIAKPTKTVNKTSTIAILKIRQE